MLLFKGGKLNTEMIGEITPKHHVIFWIVYFIITTLRWGGIHNDYIYSFKTTLLGFPIHMILCYLNIYFLMPKLVYQKKYLRYVIALVSSMILSITFVPAAIALMFKGPIVEKDNIIMKTSESLYRPVLSFVLKARWLVVLIAVSLVSIAGVMSTKLGSEFVPNLDEGEIAMHALRIPGTSLSQSIEMQKALEESIKAMPEVERVFAKIGTPNVATDAVPPSVADNFIILKPRSEWPDPKKLKSDFVAELEAIVTPIPGNRYEFLQPIQMRFNELLAGVRSELIAHTT